MRRRILGHHARRTLFTAMAAAMLLAACPAPAVADTIVTFTTNLGAFDVQLYDSQVPTTVANFLNYVNAGRYEGTLIHRSTTYNPSDIQIVQGGGFALTGNGLDYVQTFAPIALEASLPNLRGTIAMARTNDPNSATSQWFFNVTDNPALNPAPGNDGYAVFGQVIGSGMNVVDAIAAVTVYDASVQLGGAFSQLPLLNPSLTAENLVMVSSVAVPEPSTIVLAFAGICGLVACRRRPQRA